MLTAPVPARAVRTGPCAAHWSSGAGTTGPPPSPQPVLRGPVLRVRQGICPRSDQPHTMGNHNTTQCTDPVIC